VSTPQETIQDLIAFVLREYQVQLEEQATQDLLSDRALVALGYAIDGLDVTGIDNSSIIMTCPSNDSRFRPGDTLTFQSHGEKSFNGTLLDLQQNGRELRISLGDKPPTIGSGPWLLTENGVNMISATIKALEKLQPGAAGWGFAQQLLGYSGRITPLPTLPGRGPTLSSDDIYNQLIQDTGKLLDNSQQIAFHRCLALPQGLGVQGPPGTGKTLLLGFVAEGFERMGKRVVILALTHQAVNNALTAIHRLFPSRQVIKVGDELRTDSLDPEISIIKDARQLRDLPPDTIVGMTYMASIQRLMLNDNRPLNPHVVIIDEAGQLPLAQGISTGLCGAGTILLFGDDRQMPPVFISSLSEEPLAVSLFAQQRQSQPNSILMLDTTYRMNQELCDRIGTTFYSDSTTPLKPDISARERILDNRFQGLATSQITREALNPSHALIWLKVPTHKHMQMNQAEASIVADIVQTCLTAGLPPSEIAVVTPFRRQAMLVRSLLSQGMGSSENLPIIDTVERVQGATVEVVVFSFCASQPDYVTSLANFLFSPNRLNVAVSRARCKAIVISSPNVFDVLPLDHQGIIGRNLCKGLLEQGHTVFAAT